MGQGNKGSSSRVRLRIAWSQHPLAERGVCSTGGFVKFLLPFILLLSASAFGADYYVSLNGNDANAGTEGDPWRTIQKAADSLAAGDTAFVRAGIYRERVTVNVSGNAEGGFVTLQAYSDERVVIDGAKLNPPKNADTALMLIRDQSYVRVKGFEIRRYKATLGNRVPCGVFIVGECAHIEIRDNNIHHIAYNSKRGNAFGLAVYGTSTTKPITDLIIDGNEVHHCKLGNSESLAINGNVTGFEVTNNRVHDNNNIGVVFIGYEGTCPDPEQDRARDGVCRGNTVWNISSHGNPAYGRAFSAGGIYVDGGTRVLIERNVSHHCDIGVELASEHQDRTTSEVTLRNNLIYRNRIGGLFMGGYDAKRGRTEQCVVRHNTFFENDTRRDGNGELYLQFYTSANSITHNVFVAGKQSQIIGNPVAIGSGNVVDYNLYFAPVDEADCTWQWNKVEYAGLTAYRSASGNDAHSLFGDAKFVNPSTFDFHLGGSSPAINAGEMAFLPQDGELDGYGQPRLQGGRVDLGASEFQ